MEFSSSAAEAAVFSVDDVRSLLWEMFAGLLEVHDVDECLSELLFERAAGGSMPVSIAADDVQHLVTRIISGHIDSDSCATTAAPLLKVSSNVEEESTADAVVSVIMAELSGLNLIRSAVKSVLQRHGYDIDAAMTELSLGEVVSTPASLASSSSSSSSLFLAQQQQEKSTQDAVIDMVLAVIQPTPFTRSEIRKVLKSTAYDVDNAVNILLQCKTKQQLNDSLQKQQKQQSSGKPHISHRKVSDKHSFAAIAKKRSNLAPNSVSLVTTSGDSKLNANVDSSSDEGPAGQSKSTKILTVHSGPATSALSPEETVITANSPLNKHSEEEWREIAQIERAAMIAEFKRACAISRNSTKASNMAFAGFVGSRGLDAKQRYLYAQKMMEICVFNRINVASHIELGVRVLTASSQQVLSLDDEIVVVNFPSSRMMLRVDLHGVCVQFAERAVEAIIHNCRMVGGYNSRNVVFVVGRGIHSKNGVARLKPAVAGKLHQMNVSYTVSEGEIVINHL
jgi:hypothetical protein